MCQKHTIESNYRKNYIYFFFDKNIKLYWKNLVFASYDISDILKS